jgi:hypothetical protein
MLVLKRYKYSKSLRLFEQQTKYHLQRAKVKFRLNAWLRRQDLHLRSEVYEPLILSYGERSSTLQGTVRSAMGVPRPPRSRCARNWISGLS